MSKGYVIAAGLVVLLAAKTIGWLFNSMTEEEREKQERERERAEKIRKRAGMATAAQASKQAKIERETADEYAEGLLRLIREYREEVAGISAELKKLEQMINAEVADKTSSPYRKSALRREYARLEDAKVRMQEYQRYLLFAEEQIQSLLRQGQFAQLLALDPVEPLLPLEWLYPGKLVLVAMSEIGMPLPRFGHQIFFGKKDDFAQKALALEYNDEIPVLIKSAHKYMAGHFYGCVARGALYYHHIIPGNPVQFVVDHKVKQVIIGSLFGGMLRAVLPVNQCLHPAVRLLSGQKVQVYPTHYDLCLSHNPFTQPRTGIEVSEFNYQARSVQSYQQLYVEVDEQYLNDVTDQRFFEAEEPWTLLGYAAATGVISLAKASVRVECIPGRDNQALEVQQVVQCGLPQLGIDTPFRFTLIGQQLARQASVGWVSGVEEFLRFCAQSALDMQESPARLAQSRFYQRWEQVIAYQRRCEEVFTLDYPLAIAEREEGVLRLMRDRMPMETRESFEQVSEQLREVLSESTTLNPDHCVRLHQWDAERGEFIPALRNERKSRPVYTRTKECISIEGSFLLPQEAAPMLRLVITIPNAALKRQGQALDDFFNDQLVNPALKNILLAPEHYLPQQQQLDAPIEWMGSLDESQKRVVELALKERNIALIQGPPGAGKTTAIVEMLYQLFHRNPSIRILVVSQQNSAVDNALGKFLDQHADALEQPIRTIRIGNPEKMSTAIKPLGFDSQYTDYLAELEKRAVDGAVSLPREQATLCHKWLCMVRQAAQARTANDEFFITLLADRNLVGATCVGLATNKGGVDQLQFDLAIIDEAGRATVPEILIPILRSRKVILVGDHYQLPPSIAPLLREDDAAQELGFLRESFLDTSFFEVMFERLPAECRETLNLQYRMAPAIGDLVSELFYTRHDERVLHNGHDPKEFEKRYVLEKSIYWVDVKGRQRQSRHSKSKENSQEVKEIARFLGELAESTQAKHTVAVITPYGGQKERIRERLRALGWSEGRLGTLEVAVDTVDAFQGSEADIVCYSTVRTEGSLNFLLDRKRLNVACSRARLHLVFFGHRDFLSRWKSRDAPEENLFPQIMKYSCNLPIKLRAAALAESAAIKVETPYV